MIARLAVLALALTPMALPRLAAGQDAASSSPANPFSVRADAHWIGAGAFATPSDTWLNRGNRTLRIPQTTWLGELRINTRVEIGSRWQVVVRPRVRGTIEATRADGTPRATGRGATFEMTDAYLHWRAGDAVSIAYGLQNFQWGPAEMMGPSNRLFHEVGVFRDPLYSVRGKHLARVNVSAGRQWNLVALAELGATSEAPFRAGTAFRRAGQAKLEFTTASGAAYLGVTAGARGGEPPWTGGYAAVTMSSGLSAYVDASVQRGSQAWYPVRTGAGSTRFAADARTGGARALALAGLRYTMSAALDARFEVLHQGAGYTRQQLAAAPLAVAGHPSPDTVRQWISPGLEFLGRGLALVSIVGRDLPPARRLVLQGRYVRSLTDRSGAAFITASVDATSALAVFGSVTSAHGRDLAEFTRLARAGGVTGVIWSW